MYSSCKVIVNAAARLLVLLPWTVGVQAELKEYTWHVHPRRSRAPLSPDCFLDRDMLLINDKNPGEALRASVGDRVRVTIVNHSPSEGLAMHYHGISMFNQPYSDGAATRSQCNVGPMQASIPASLRRGGSGSLPPVLVFF
jgi:FtsP/CotA-like multicopper oxidase with cupredoxin domain